MNINPDSALCPGLAAHACGAPRGVQRPRAGAFAMQRAFERRLASLGDVLEFVDVFAAREKLTGRTAFAARLVTEELFANFVRHNKGGEDRIEIAISVDAGLLTLKLWDFAVEPFDITGRGPVDVSRPLSERTAGGLGLHFVRSYFDELTYEYSNGTMCVTATRGLGRADV